MLLQEQQQQERQQQRLFQLLVNHFLELIVELNIDVKFSKCQKRRNIDC